MGFWKELEAKIFRMLMILVDLNMVKNERNPRVLT